MDPIKEFEDKIKDAFPKDAKTNKDALAANNPDVFGSDPTDEDRPGITPDDIKHLVIEDGIPPGLDVEHLAEDFAGLQEFDRAIMRDAAKKDQKEEIIVLSPEEVVNIVEKTVAPEAPKFAPVETIEQLEALLLKNGLTEEEALMLILSGQKPISEKAQIEVWDAELQSSGYTKDDIFNAIHESLATGFIQKDFSFESAGRKVSLVMRSRTDAEDRRVERAMRDLYNETDGNVTNDEATRARFLWQVACSLVELDGFGHVIRGTDVVSSNSEKTIQEIVARISAGSTIAFDILCKAVAKLDLLVYLASRRLSIENF